MILERIESDLCVLKGFMELLRGFELPDPVDPKLSRRLCYTLSYDIARLVRLSFQTIKNPNIVHADSLALPTIFSAFLDGYLRGILYSITSLTFMN